MAPKKRTAKVEADSTPRRTSRRISSTPKKSHYFEDSESDDSELPPKKRGRPAKKPKLEKEDSEDQYKDEDPDDNEPEDEDEDEDDEDAPPKVTIIPLEKLRDTGGVEYEDFKVHKNTLLFLKDLKANNRRPWLKCKHDQLLNNVQQFADPGKRTAHDGEYRRALQDWNSFVERATESIIEVDETIPELPVKDVIFRIHRDIRFSKDPTPYKVSFEYHYFARCKPPEIKEITIR